MVFYYGWACGLGQAMDDANFFPLGEFDLRSYPGLFRRSTWRADSSKLDLTACLYGLQLIGFSI